jgi:LemA protein
MFWAAVTLLVIYTVSIYNHLVRLKHNVSKAWSNIDVLLKQRHDEIPKLVETCKQYMKYEQETLEKVMQARSQVAQARQNQDVPGLGMAEGALRMGLGQLFALAEDYPELRANENFQHLQTRISTLENTIADLSTISVSSNFPISLWPACLASVPAICSNSRQPKLPMST